MLLQKRNRNGRAFDRDFKGQEVSGIRNEIIVQRDQRTEIDAG